MNIIIPVLMGLSVTAIIMAAIYSLQGNRLIIMQRLRIYTMESKENYLIPELAKPFKERIKDGISLLVNLVSNKIIPANKKEIYDKKLSTAGNPLGLNAETYLTLKYFLPVLTLILGLLIGHIVAVILFVLIGILIPDLWLKANEDRRKDKILRNLPDVLDLLSVSVEAGLSFDGAMQKVIEKSQGPLSSELEKALREMEMGKPRREALRDLAERVNVDDVSLFVGSIMQAEQLGVPMGNVLKLQAEQVRENRKMRAEEKAQKAPVKILIPMIAFIFPTIMIVLIGPAALNLLDNL